MRHCAIALIFVFTLGATAHADPIAVVADKIKSGDEMVLNDGRLLRLAFIKAAVPEAKSFLETAIVGHPLTLQDATLDRYGRLNATVYVDGQTQSLEEIMLTAGLAFVYPINGDEPHLDGMLAQEREAFSARRGYWATHPDVSSDDAIGLYGSYGFVTGTITKAERVKNKVYLNFGADWRTDFTVQIAAHDLRAFKKQGADPLAWQGKKVRVRGWVKRDFGPMITLTDPHQIEILD